VARFGRTVESLGDYLREQRVANALSLRQLAEAAGVSNPYLSQIERGLRRPSAEVLQQIAKALQISAETLYVRAGILDPDNGEVRSVELAVLADSGLTERQKQSLIEVYRSFRAANHATEQAAGRAAAQTAPDRGPDDGPDPAQHLVAAPTEAAAPTEGE
jgi:transcriptional regulator with XRE-family HTH domain